ncbi:MAG: peptidase, partial [Thermoguttaceae bacterium]
DDRPGRTPSLVVADRANSRLQYFTPDGKHISFTHGLPNPCYFSIRGEVLLVPDLHSRVSLLDRDNRPIVHLGYDEAWTQRVQREGLRGKPQLWEPGRFVHPHHAAFDADGNIFVVEWVPIGRITRLRHIA